MTVGLDKRADGLMRTRGAGVELAFRMRGSGPAVVLLHGTSANHAVWEPIAEALASQATVIVLDQRGHGRSDKPPTGYTGREFAGDVITVLDAIGIDRAAVAGHSLGARNSWLVAAWHPDRVTGVVAVDYTPFVEESVLDDLEVRVAGGDRAFVDIAEIEQYLQSRYPRMPHDAVERRARWGYRQDGDGSWRPLADPNAMQQLIRGLRTPWDAEFAAVNAPMTHVRGVDSGIVSAAAWDAAITARRGDRWVMADDADHYVPEEHPELITTEIERALHA